MAFTNGPVFIDSQVGMITDLLKRLPNEGIQSIEAQKNAEVNLKEAIQHANDQALMPLTDSWYMGANISGKKREQLNQLLGGKSEVRAGVSESFSCPRWV